MAPLSRVLAPVVLVALLAGCSDGVDDVSRASRSAATSPPATVATAVPTSASPVPSGTSSEDAGRAAAYEVALATTRDWLQAWSRDGGAVAGQRYLEPEYRPDAGGPALVSGRVTGFRPQEWASADRFTLLVSLDLRFAGDPGAWGQGANDRFVTFTRHSPAAPYLLALATGP